MFHVSTELQNHLEGFTPNKLGRLSGKIESTVKVIDQKEFRNLVFHRVLITLALTSRV